MYFNALTRRPYSVKNAAILAVSQPVPDDFEVAGFKQWLELGRVVRKGEKGTKIYMVCDKKTTGKDGTEIKEKVFKSRTVFFRSQTVAIEAAAA